MALGTRRSSGFGKQLSNEAELFIPALYSFRHHKIKFHMFMTSVASYLSFKKLLSNCIQLVQTLIKLIEKEHPYLIYFGLVAKNLSSGVCEQHRRRPACASAQSDQRLCYSLFRKNHIKACYKRNFNCLASPCS